MKKWDKIKYHKPMLSIIDQFKEHKSGKLISENEVFNGRVARFKVDKKGYKIDFQHNILSNRNKNVDVGVQHKGIKIQLGKLIYVLESVYLGSRSMRRITGSIDRIHTFGFSETKKSYYQLIIPLEKELKFHYNIEEVHFESDLGYHSRTGTKAIISNDSLQVCCFHNDNKEYFLSIDSDLKQTFNEFAEKAHAVKIGLGYLSGFCAGNQGFYFTYGKKERRVPLHFRCVSLREAIHSSYSPIYSNAYGYLHRNISLGDVYHPLLRPVSVVEFSSLCYKIHNSLDFSSTLMLILESSVASLLFMPGGYAIALETISDLIIGNLKLKLAPIKDKTISRKIRKEFLKVLDQNSQNVSPYDLETLTKRIDQFNQTTNKARLKAPFDLLNITLMEEDLKILETRNDFLHGRVPDLTNGGLKRTTERINKDLYYCAMRFYTLLNMLILKWIGYDNRVVNYPKISENYTQIVLEEEPFRLV